MKPLVGPVSTYRESYSFTIEPEAEELINHAEERDIGLSKQPFLSLRRLEKVQR
ncbi:MAG: hypothetical protein ACUVQY_05475 [Thermoproteota archaeon]